MFTTPDVTATEASPSTAARRPRAPVSAMSPAVPIQSFDPSAARESRAANRSTGGVGVADIAAYTAASSAPTSRRTAAARAPIDGRGGPGAAPERDDNSGPGIEG